MTVHTVVGVACVSCVQVRARQGTNMAIQAKGMSWDLEILSAQVIWR